MQLDAESMTAIRNRTKRAHGHLGKVISMMDEGADCEDVALQLSAVIKALQRTGVVLVTDGMKACFEPGRDPDDAELRHLQKLFLSLA
ncbi:metal-sensitive transcriptional regulator [Intrasporangium sp.]|uniref:metal-sensitive transcriptional regulator n=1 Tax=Intrasporangium sp. TaxID=1925024 RepID=UPI00293A2A54|nr:metal-sensitive transcriptional regulator [Intrasporangium sp.]MDV3220408.1 metal-sensitive transcriptional regulator [Intrasporangium sp.]